MRPALPFISRHQPTEDQVILSKGLGFDELRHVPVTFGDDPVQDLVREHIDASMTVALVAPPWVVLNLLRAGFTVVEFVNEPEARNAGGFQCAGAFRHTLAHSEFVPFAALTNGNPESF
jgi:hypothetical protein